MYQVLYCFTDQHDWRLVCWRAVCLLASAVAISLFHRAQATQGGTRDLACARCGVAGCGIWATHFIAMLAYDPGIGAGYDVPPDNPVAALRVAGHRHRPDRGAARFRALERAIGGAVVGCGIAAMHYTGMMALEIAGRITWSPHVAASVVLGIVFGGACAVVAGTARRLGRNALIAAVAADARDRLASLHRHGRGSRSYPIPPARATGLSLSPSVASLVVAGVAASFSACAWSRR